MSFNNPQFLPQMSPRDFPYPPWFTSSCLRSHHRGHHGRCLSGSHELHGLDGLRTTLDHFLVHGGSLQPLGGGFLYQKGVIDYSGGYVIHLSSGTAGFIGAAVIGPRLKRIARIRGQTTSFLCWSVAGILWVGWNGFNGGDPYSASPDAGAAVLNTNIATAMSTLVWTIMDIIFFGKPAVIGAVQGMITGLVAITPAAGVVCRLGSCDHWPLFGQHSVDINECYGQESLALPKS